MLKKTFPVDNDWASSERMFVQEFELQFLLHRTVGPITRLFMCAEVANRRDDRPNVRPVSLTLSLSYSPLSLFFILFFSLSLSSSTSVSRRRKKKREGEEHGVGRRSRRSRKQLSDTIGFAIQGGRKSPYPAGTTADFFVPSIFRWRRVAAIGCHCG